MNLWRTAQTSDRKKVTFLSHNIEVRNGPGKGPTPFTAQCHVLLRKRLRMNGNSVGLIGQNYLRNSGLVYQSLLEAAVSCAVWLCNFLAIWRVKTFVQVIDRVTKTIKLEKLISEPRSRILKLGNLQRWC